MVFASNDSQLVIGRLVNKPMRVCDAARPISFEVTFEWLGFADTSKWRLGSFGDQATNALKHSLIHNRPFVVLLESQLMKGDDSH